MTKFDWVFMISIVALIVVQIYRPLDNTDDVKRNERSGLKLYTDYGTGCQYVKGGFFGGTTPRLNNAGLHICGASTEDLTDTN